MKRMRDVVQEARKQGHKVVVRKENDGSGETRIRVVSIDGKKYKKSQGNNELRKMMGEELSDRMRAQRRKANLGDGTPSGQASQREKHVSAKKGEKLPKLTKKELNQLRRMNRKVRKSGHGFQMTVKQRRKMKKERSAEENRRQMERRETASRGDVYNEKVDDLLKDMRYIIDQGLPGAKYARKVIAWFNRHGRVGSGGRYKFYKGHSVSDEAFYKAEQLTYKLSKRDADEGELREAFDAVMHKLDSGLKIDGKPVGK